MPKTNVQVVQKLGINHVQIVGITHTPKLQNTSLCRNLTFVSSLYAPLSQFIHQVLYKFNGLVVGLYTLSTGLITKTTN